MEYLIGANLFLCGVKYLEMNPSEVSKCIFVMKTKHKQCRFLGGAEKGEETTTAMTNNKQKASKPNDNNGIIA